MRQEPQEKWQEALNKWDKWINALNETTAEVRNYINLKNYPDLEQIVSSAPSLLAPNVFDSLSDTARYDFIEAGQCIAFERPKAAAFHLMRTTEGILRQLYCLFVKRDRVELMWGPMVIHLKQRSHLHFGPLLNHLDHIRISFRNPTQHPEKIYDIQEVQDLFGLCVDAINRMVTLMKTHKTK